MALGSGIPEYLDAGSQPDDAAYDADGEYADDEWFDEPSEVYYDRSSDLDPFNPIPPSSDDGYNGIYSDTEDSGSRGCISQAKLLYTPHSGFGNSQKWVSEKEKARDRFQRCLTNLHHMGCDSSFVIPATVDEWVELKIQYAEANIARAECKLRLLLSDHNTERHELVQGEDRFKFTHGLVGLSQKLKSTAQLDGKSTVLMRSTRWNTEYTKKPLVDWPPYREFKAEGDDRVRGSRAYGRKLPLPKLRKMDKVHYKRLKTDLENVPTEGADVPYDLREIDTSLISILTDTKPQTEELREGLAVFEPRFCFQDNEEILLDQVDGFTQALIKEIDSSL